MGDNNRKNRGFFKIQNQYRRRIKKRNPKNNDKFEVLIIAMIFLAIIILKWLD